MLFSGFSLSCILVRIARVFSSDLFTSIHWKCYILSRITAVQADRLLMSNISEVYLTLTKFQHKYFHCHIFQSLISYSLYDAQLNLSFIYKHYQFVMHRVPLIEVRSTCKIMWLLEKTLHALDLPSCFEPQFCGALLFLDRFAVV